MRKNLRVDSGNGVRLIACILALSLPPFGRGSNELFAKTRYTFARVTKDEWIGHHSKWGVKKHVHLLLRGGASISESTSPKDTISIAENVYHNITSSSNSSDQAQVFNSQHDEEEDEDWRRQLPEQLQQRKGALHRILVPTIHRKDNGDNKEDERYQCQIYLLGTAHVSNSSCVDARLLMEAVKPDLLFMELCSSRTGILEDTPEELLEMQQQENGKKQGTGQMVKDIIERNPDMSRSAAFSTVLLNQIQGDYASKLGVTIGGEFKEAFQMAKKQHKEFEKWQRDLRWQQTFGTGRTGEVVDLTTKNDGTNPNPCTIILGDRPVRLTLLRAWESLSFLGKIKLVIGLLISSFRKPSSDELKKWMESIMNDPNNDLLTKSIEELSHHFPTIKRTIIEERDTFMTAKLLQLSNMVGAYYSGMNCDRNYTIVAIVGAGHCPGILKRLEEVKSDLNKLDCLEELLEQVIETKKYKLDCEDMRAVVTDVVSMDLSQTNF